LKIIIKMSDAKKSKGSPIINFIKKIIEFFVGRKKTK